MTKTEREVKEYLASLSVFATVRDKLFSVTRCSLLPVVSKGKGLAEPAADIFIQVRLVLNDNVMHPSARIGFDGLDDLGMRNVFAQREAEDDAVRRSVLCPFHWQPDPGKLPSARKRDLCFGDLDVYRTQGLGERSDVLIESSLNRFPGKQLVDGPMILSRHSPIVTKVPVMSQSDG